MLDYVHGITGENHEVDFSSQNGTSLLSCLLIFPWETDNLQLKINKEVGTIEKEECLISNQEMTIKQTTACQDSHTD